MFIYLSRPNLPFNFTFNHTYNVNLVVHKYIPSIFHLDVIFYLFEMFICFIGILIRRTNDIDEEI